MYKDIEELIDEYSFADAILLDEFSATTKDDGLSDCHEVTLWGLTNKNGNVIDYAIDHYWTGLQPGCFGVREVTIIPDLSYWNCEKRFYYKIATEFRSIR